MKPKMTESKKVQNTPSNLLTFEENQKIFYALGKQCTTLATTVVQLYLTEEPYHSTWCKKGCGVICFVKDNERRSYFIKLYDMDKGAWVWEQELYNPFTYKPACTFFQVFEADTCMAGLNFADNDEALNFKSEIQKKLQMREEKKRERKRAQQNTLQPSNAGIIATRAKSQSSQSLANGKEEKKEKKKKKKLTKDDIGAPSNFTHLQHVGWHPEKGFNVDSLDNDLKFFFKMAGVSARDLSDCDTRNFIYDFIENHGGVEKAKQEIAEKCTPPPVPVREVPQTPRPPRGNQTRAAAPPPPPPPPPSVPPVFQPPTLNIPKTNNVPPPPPPPPPPSTPLGGNLSIPPPPPPPGKNTSLANDTRQYNQPTDNRSALLDQIKKGKELHHVEINGNDLPSLDSGDNARGALLNQIKQGVILKPVSEDSRAAPNAVPMDGLAGALARALQERSRAIQQTDESGSSSEDDDGDEWD